MLEHERTADHNARMRCRHGYGQYPRLVRGRLYFEIDPVLFPTFAQAASAWSTAQAHRLTNPPVLVAGGSLQRLLSCSVLSLSFPTFARQENGARNRPLTTRVIGHLAS